MPIYASQPIRRCWQSGGQTVGVARTRLTYDGAGINGVDQCIMMRLLNDVTMDFCRHSGGVCIDLASELEFDDADFYDFYHNSPKGAEKIGRYLHRKLGSLF